MTEKPLDEIDQQILEVLQEDARNNTNTLIGDRVGISPSTVGKRIKQLEETGIIRGYNPSIDYAEAKFPLRVLFICTASIDERSDIVEETQKLKGVVSVRELMTGRENVHVEVVGAGNPDVTRLATTIGDIGLTIEEEILVKNEYQQPASVFAE